MKKNPKHVIKLATIHAIPPLFSHIKLDKYQLKRSSSILLKLHLNSGVSTISDHLSR